MAALRHAYTARLDLVRAPRRTGPGLIGVVDNTIPVELILACGRVPILIAADAGRPTPNADRYMEEVISPETKSLFEHACLGDYEFLDLLIVSRAHAHLYYYLKEVYRLGRGPRFPALHMYDLMQSQREAVRAYNWGRTEALIDRLERLSAEEITEGRLRWAIARTNQQRAVQRRLLDLRWAGHLSGVNALQAIGAAYFMSPDAYIPALETYLAEMRPDEALRDRPRLLVVTSVPLGGTHVHAALEAAGALVVAEDDWWGSRAPGADVPLAESPKEAILRKYWLDTASAGVYPAEAREAWLRQHALRPDVDGVVFYVPPSDRQLGWDYPRLKKWLDDSEKPSLLVREDATDPAGESAIRGATERFIATLPRRNSR
ncbi:MAG TPA: 2-hydroxyacyl-CoA dehydratase family protein [Chloroflexota bacterium]|nr:2-hydroxyacyl-CoA dehydratase family protein [Chloroflexota bacterium]